MPPLPPPPPPPPPVDDQETIQGTVTNGPTDTPPRKSRPSAKPQGEKAGPAPRMAPLQKRLEEFFAVPAAVYAAAGHHYPAEIIALRSPALAEDLNSLAQQNPAVKRVLTKMLEGSAWGGVVLSASSILIPLLSYHGVIPVGDPFQMVMPAPQRDQRRPIVPPPPGPQVATPVDTNGGGGANGFTPPIAPGQPPGVVTVAGTGAAI